MPLKNALTSLKFSSKAGRSAELLFGLAMCSSGRRPDPAKNLFFCAGPSEQRAAQRSAARRSRSGGPKKKK